ncbi:hypothetical protein [Streptomyces sp. NPDC001089]
MDADHRGRFGRVVGAYGAYGAYGGNTDHGPVRVPRSTASGVRPKGSFTFGADPRGAVAGGIRPGLRLSG